MRLTEIAEGPVEHVGSAVKQIVAGASRRRRRKAEQNSAAARCIYNQRFARIRVAVLTLLGIYVLIGLLLATVWSGESAKRHVGGLKTFVLVVAAWPMIVCAMIIAGRYF